MCPPQAHPTPAVKETNYHCCYGPMDFSTPPVEGPIEKGKRRGKIQRGESRKRGCLCHFTVRIAGGSDSVADLRMYCSDHRNAAGAACHKGLQWSQKKAHSTKRQRPTPQKAAGPVSSSQPLLDDVPPDSIVSRV